MFSNFRYDEDDTIDIEKSALKQRTQFRKTYGKSTCSAKTHIGVHYKRMIDMLGAMCFYAVWRPESKNFILKQLIS